MKRFVALTALSIALSLVATLVAYRLAPRLEALARRRGDDREAAPRGA